MPVDFGPPRVDPFEQAIELGAGRVRRLRSVPSGPAAPAPVQVRLPRQRAGNCTTAPVRRRPVRRPGVPSAAVASEVARRVSDRRPAPRLRLTRRGRALVRTVVLVALAIAAIAIAVSSRADDVTPVSSRSMVVTEHDTLWTIAEEASPSRPRSETMAKIRELNHMPDATVHVGQRLLLPAP
ncbi:LysM peptidoglycan-binding domain-containing protein [Cryptosporangium phraense]|uniref:LysM peptidoglycan-binding domain-containing protein n=1 Tax=Cryptosporangium phraense TaxID=2593070 RepID=A0A545AW61_9ACTN|nr:LysM peptidoglycan-binding domain-containing protein [Cryptosporangium phraense]TQS44855.1 LysM peptidoglycan-binding domain-containing protein [Cryptosporangium phraense]